jgi:acyl-homoserine-lactone acylase
MRLTLLALAALLCLLAAEARAAEPRGTVTIRRAAEGTPHIRATTWEGLGYGFARAHAEDNLCLLASQYATVRAERSRFFGPQATYALENTGTHPHNLESDFFWARIATEQVVERLVAQPAPRGPQDKLKEGVRGYTQGYNDFIRANAGNVKDPACAGKPWVQPIREIDVYRRFYQLAMLASQMVALDGIGGAQPPTPALGGQQRTPEQALAAIPPEELEERFEPRGVGSNAIALGRDATENGKGMLLGNPHQPWQGTERFYQSHLTIPGDLDVSGASLYGVPLVNIGFNRDLAWSHTVSTARRFVIQELQLVPGSPTTYLVDGEAKEMKRTEVTVQALRADGTLEPRTRTLYATEWGPILTSLQELPLFPWRPDRAFSMFDANAENFGRLLNHFYEVNRAKSVDELHAILRRHQGIPWVNTIAADRAGEAYYADIGATPGVPDAKLAACSTAVGAALDQAARVQVLDGSRSACDPDSSPAAAGRGILPPDAQPFLRRTDYTENSNDSHWLSNARTRLEGFPRIIGEERTQRSLRTRMAMRIIEDALKDGGRFSQRELRDAMFDNRVMAAELWRDELVAMCRTESVPAAACDVLQQWSGRDDLDARGALLFRRFAQRALEAPSPFRTPFDPNDPVNTPNGLNTSDPAVRLALHQAIDDLAAAGVSFDAPLSALQYETRGERIPLHGGPSEVGVFNVLQTSWNASKGYTDVQAGQTYIQAVEFTDSRTCPVHASTNLGHSLSTDPTSPWYANGTRQIARKDWTEQPFCAADVQKATKAVATYGTTPILSGVRWRKGRVSFRLSRRARVTITLLKRGKPVRRIRVTRKAGRHSLRIRTRGRPSAYRVRVIAR